MEILAIIVALILVGLFWRVLARVAGVIAVVGIGALGVLAIVSGSVPTPFLVLGGGLALGLALCAVAFVEHRRDAACATLERDATRQVDACYDMVVRKP